MNTPMILTVSAPRVLQSVVHLRLPCAADSGETALYTPGGLMLHGASITLDTRPDETRFVVACR
jgi:hypothetical protein